MGDPCNVYVSVLSRHLAFSQLFETMANVKFPSETVTTNIYMY